MFAAKAAKSSPMSMAGDLSVHDAVESMPDDSNMPSLLHRRFDLPLVCMYACVYVCMHACVYVCMHVCMYVCMHVCIYVCMYACVYVCMHVCMYVCMHVCI
jgi:hypothetical protein